MWRPAFFGIKPELVVKGGFIVWAAMGDSAASLMTCEPMLMRPQWGAFGRAKQASERELRASRVAIERGLAGRARPGEAILPVERHAQADTSATCCTTTPARRSAVDPQTFDVFVDGELATCEPATVLPLTQRYMLR